MLKSDWCVFAIVVMTREALMLARARQASLRTFHLLCFAACSGTAGVNTYLSLAVVFLSFSLYLRNTLPSMSGRGKGGKGWTVFECLHQSAP